MHTKIDVSWKVAIRRAALRECYEYEPLTISTSVMKEEESMWRCVFTFLIEEAIRLSYELERSSQQERNDEEHFDQASR